MKTFNFVRTLFAAGSISLLLSCGGGDDGGDDNGPSNTGYTVVSVVVPRNAKTWLTKPSRS